MEKKEFLKIMNWAKEHFGPAFARFHACDLKMIKEMYYEYNS